MNTDKRRWALAAFSLQLSAFSFLLSGCGLPAPQADPVRHFTLGGDAGAAPVANAVQVRPVQLAAYLRRRPIAVRVAANEVTFLEEDRWAEPLDAALTRLLRARLASVGGGAVVTVNVERFEPVRSAGNRLELAATYTITPAAGGEVQRGAFTSSPRTWDGRDPGALVGLMREAAAELGDALAAAVAALPAS